LGLDVIHLDRHWWQPGDYVIKGRQTVKERTLPSESFRRLQSDLVARERWIIDGGVDALALRLPRADTIIFLDLSRWLCVWRVVRRTGNPRDDYPPGVRESWRWMLLLVRWILFTYPRHRRPAIQAAIEQHGSHAHVLQMRSRSDVQAFLDAVRTNHRIEGE
jgi:adenylate kinase family enzyme